MKYVICNFPSICNHISYFFVAPFWLLQVKTSQLLHQTPDSVRDSKSTLEIHPRPTNCMRHACNSVLSVKLIINLFLDCCRSDGLILGCCGFHGDVLTVTKNIEVQMKVLFNGFFTVRKVSKVYQTRARQILLSLILRPLA